MAEPSVVSKAVNTPEYYRLLHLFKGIAHPGPVPCPEKSFSHTFQTTCTGQVAKNQVKKELKRLLKARFKDPESIYDTVAVWNDAVVAGRLGLRPLFDFFYEEDHTTILVTVKGNFTDRTDGLKGVHVLIEVDARKHINVPQQEESDVLDNLADLFACWDAKFGESDSSAGQPQGGQEGSR